MGEITALCLKIPVNQLESDSNMLSGTELIIELEERSGCGIVCAQEI